MRRLSFVCTITSNPSYNRYRVARAEDARSRPAEYPPAGAANPENSKCPTSKSRAKEFRFQCCWLSGVILDNEAFLEGLVELVAFRLHEHFGRQCFDVGADPLGAYAYQTGLHAFDLLFAIFLDGNDLTRLEAHRSNRCLLAVNQDVTVGDELASLRSASYQSGAEKNVVEARFQNLKHNRAGYTFLGYCFGEIVEELLFGDVVRPTNFLFFEQVCGVLRALLAVAAMLTRWVRLSGDSTFDAAAYTGTDCSATFTSGSNVSQTTNLLSKIVKTKWCCENQTGQPLPCFLSAGECTLGTAAQLNTRAFNARIY